MSVAVSRAVYLWVDRMHAHCPGGEDQIQTSVQGVHGLRAAHAWKLPKSEERERDGWNGMLCDVRYVMIR